jgi:hypothetical protein
LVPDEPTNHLDRPAIEQPEVRSRATRAPCSWSPTTAAPLVELSLTRRIDLADGPVRPAHPDADAPPPAASAPEGS